MSKSFALHEQIYLYVEANICRYSQYGKRCKDIILSVTRLEMSARQKDVAIPIIDVKVVHKSIEIRGSGVLHASKKMHHTYRTSMKFHSTCITEVVKKFITGKVYSGM